MRSYNWTFAAVADLLGSVQENAIMQTCVGSVAGLSFTGGFGSYLIAMDQQSYENVGNVAGNNAWVRLPV